MPCDSLTTVEVVVEKMDHQLLMQALTELQLEPCQRTRDEIYFGAGSSYNCKTGKMRLSTARDVAQMTKEIKRAYSEQVVLSQAKKYGWTVKKTAPYEYEVLKRS